MITKMRWTNGPDPERDRKALEEERRRMIAEDRDEEWKKSGLKAASRGSPRS